MWLGIFVGCSSRDASEDGLVVVDGGTSVWRG